MELHTIGIGPGKTAFHLVGLNVRGEVVVRKKFSRTPLLRFTAKQRVDFDWHGGLRGSPFSGTGLVRTGA
jgi:transposase